MATLTEHAEIIKAAIKAAEEDGFVVEADLTYGYDDLVTKIELDIWDGSVYLNVFKEDRD